LDFGKTSFLFTGDIEKGGEEELLARGAPLAATVLKVGHHGSRNATSEPFLDAVNPKVAVISTERRSAAALPHDTVLQRLQSRGIKVLWTGRDGAVTVETDGERLTKITAGRIRPGVSPNP